ncbi:4'-phosphopantetheinyl transferase superfamily protein [Bradyrhizobium sp. 160]|uniref:4'-phosphopantetheinyl transferase family protein n=1 Tax=Bradyrhizobium sp. 160 TaxID=2782634 RepID=UPI001FFB2188|nr:4'-phosphopantetheinyl transferase superfamily protein [Bradyrhizobium sp. 160]MCK1627358.1 4'-phosphopantetheinyl transferase superfamily protein [Bradyrhizobium sp. 160]
MTAVCPFNRRDEIQVWSITLAVSPSTLSYCVSLLSDDEREKARKYRYSRDSRRFIAGRAALRFLLGSYFNWAPQKVGFCRSAEGRLSLSFGPTSAVSDFNLSHSADEMIVVISSLRRVGVDIERVDAGRCAEQEWASVLSPAEMYWCADASHGERVRKYLTLWTRKEALLKADGRGLQVDPLCLDVTETVQTATPFFYSCPSLSPSQWTLWDLPLGGRLVGSLASEGWSRVPKISYFSLPADFVLTPPSFGAPMGVGAH